MPRELHDHDQHHLAQRGARLRAAAPLLGGAGHADLVVVVAGQPTCQGQSGPRHQPFMQVLIRQAPQRAQHSQQEEGLLAVPTRAPTRTGWQRQWAVPLRQAHRQPAQCQQVQLPDQGEGIQVQCWAALGLRPTIGGRRDRYYALIDLMWNQDHGPISLIRGQTASGGSAYPMSAVMQCPH
jgi:hypothetical protein